MRSQYWVEILEKQHVLKSGKTRQFYLLVVLWSIFVVEQISRDFVQGIVDILEIEPFLKKMPHVASLGNKVWM